MMVDEKHLVAAGWLGAWLAALDTSLLPVKAHKHSFLCLLPQIASPLRRLPPLTWLFPLQQTTAFLFLTRFSLSLPCCTSLPQTASRRSPTPPSWLLSWRQGRQYGTMGPAGRAWTPLWLRWSCRTGRCLQKQWGSAQWRVTRIICTSAASLCLSWQGWAGPLAAPTMYLK